MTPGELYWIEFPGGAGRAQAGRRPAIIVQGMRASAKLPTLLVVPLTTQLDALRFPGTLLVEPDPQNGLRLPSVALAFQMTAIDRRFLGPQLGQLSQEHLQQLWAAFRDLTTQ